MKKIILALIAATLISACSKPDIRPELGEAPAVQMPKLPDTLNQRAKRLPDITDGTVGGLTREGVATDQAYNDLSHRHNAVLTAWECVRLAINARDTKALSKCFEGDTSAIPETPIVP